ncbi:hypothetical protein M9Y10_001633 [Tritrichomonas musculus]|uniref:Beta-lactamase n=1 Tax=Tritrichomonas musculus TaxID=1915356 RepID=A0ABR2L7J2_9EUKA
MYKNCVHYSPSKRLTDEMIKVIISNEINFFSSQEQSKITNYEEEELSQFIFEDMMIKQKCLRNYSFLNPLENEMKSNFLINSEIEQRIKSILLEYYELLSEWNDPTALNNLGYMYHYGNCVEQNYSKAIEYYELAASLSNSNSLANLGLIYELGPERDYSKAKEYYELSAKKNNAEVISYLGDLYYNGKGVEKDYQKAKEYFEQSGELNCSFAFYNLSHIYRYGYGVEKNETKAKEYELLAKYDFNSEDLIDLGNQYKYGDGVEKDYDKARKYFEMSAKLNTSKAYISLGSLYYHGYGVKKDNAKAKEYYEISAKMCNSRAILKLGNLYFFEKNYVKAIEYYKLASKLNNPQAFTNLGYLYFSGHGVKQNYSKAKEYYEIAAQYNNKDALDKLGNLYEHGNGVTIDYLLSRHYYERSAKLNYEISFIRLGKLYYNGIGVDKNYSKAFEYYQLSLKFKNPVSYYRIGYMYEKGLGVDQDYHKAKEYYELSAEFNHSDSLLWIGHLYRKGHGVKQNILVAKHFYQLSAKFNNSHSFFNLARMYSNIDILVDFTKAVKYFIKCSQIHNEKEIVKDYRDRYFRFHRYNKFFYRSYNDVDLIYLLIFNDIEKANEYIKQSAFGEYPFGQNNFGLLNEIYFNEKGNAEYMYTKSSKKHFALAEYNLAHYLENNDKNEESITYYIRASEDENLQLSFQNHRHNDKQLEISKKFIICLTNLKLTKFYFSNENLNESKKYFIRTFAKFESSSYKFHFRFVNEKAKNPFLYLKAFIFNFPSFNLINQPYLNLNIKDDIKNLFHLSFNDHKEVAKIRQKENNLKDSTDEEYLIKQKENNFNLDIDSSYFNQSIQKSKELQLSRFDDYIFENTSQLFDFSMKKENLKSYLISEIIDIIHTMETILYTPPYSILFGRINQESKNKEKIETKNIILRDINELFYEGFGYDV